MDLNTFRKIVDRMPAGITDYKDDPARLYAYAGLNFDEPHQVNAVGDALDARIRTAFKGGGRTAAGLCRGLQTDLIREHVILNAPLDPYYNLLGRIRDALKLLPDTGEIDSDWDAAIKGARDGVEMCNLPTNDLRRPHAREFAVADAAKALKQAGYSIRLEPGLIALEIAAEKSLVSAIEKLIAQIGGLNIARKIFEQITPTYDADLGRYQLVPSISLTGGGQPQIPWGYLLHLAIKHIDGIKPYSDLQAHWPLLLSLATAYAAVVDVQPYYPTVWGSLDAKGLLKYLQEQAIYDSMFRFPQLRASDVLKICRGALTFVNMDMTIADGCKLSEIFDVIGYLVDPIRDARGPVAIDERAVKRALPRIHKKAITTIFRDVLSHSVDGANQSFSLPTDTPGADFYLKPLIRRQDNRYLIVDRSMCGWGYVEALFSALRSTIKEFDNQVGTAMERFVEAELSSRGVPVLSGEYDEDGHGECDIAAETPQTVVFIELKKKALTRRARAGSDAHLLLDLAGSLLDAQVQAGWHELRITHAGALNLVRNGQTRCLSLDSRGIEKIALGMLDFGSFQDRVVLKQFLEATLNVNFGSHDPVYAKRFKAINDALQEIRKQYSATHAGKVEVHQPFFNCWFMSIPQFLILLDEVTDAETFRSALWSCRHIVTGTSDLYFEIANMRRMKVQATAH